MKQVIENGNAFTKKHVFMLLEELNYESINDLVVCRYLRILIDDLNISEEEYDAFCDLIKDDKQRETLIFIRDDVFAYQEIIE